MVINGGGEQETTKITSKAIDRSGTSWNIPCFVDLNLETLNYFTQLCYKIKFKKQFLKLKAI